MFRVVKLLVFIIFSVFMAFGFCYAEDSVPTLSATISMEDSLPADFFGTWRVVSKLEHTDSPKNFKISGVDIWNLSKTNDVINLSNPFTGASAYVRIDYVENGTIRFTKEGNYDNQKLTDTVEITLSGNKFVGKNYLSLKTYSDADNSLLSEKKAVYSLKGDKISGESVLER